jgi:phosphatidylserine decarboxylase
MTNLISIIFGLFASHQFTPAIQNLINSSYAKIFELDMSEFEPVENYKSLNKLFTRKLLKQRDFDKNESLIISPCDAKITEFGSLDGILLLQIKGKSYSLAELLGSKEEAKKYENGQFVNFYLSPRDYHRFHAPMDMKVVSSTHIPGDLYPVNMPALNNINSLFAKNERVILECEDSKNNHFYLVFIGALNVGKILISFDERIKTNSRADKITHYEYNNQVLKKGDELGMFEMGSSIVAVFPKEYASLNIQRMQKVSFGQTIAMIK